MHWYDWHTVTERLQGRSYALTRGRPYKVVLDPLTPTGVCDFTNKRISINPSLFDDVFRKRGLSGDALDRANFLVSRAVTGHEALHVVYSDPAVAHAASSSPLLKTVMNLLEDARIEKIGSEISHVSKVLFRFVNKIAAGDMETFTVEKNTGHEGGKRASANTRVEPPSAESSEDDLDVEKLLEETAAQSCEDLGELVEEHGAQVLAKLAGIQALTLTRTAPTLTDAVSDLKSRPEEIKQVVLIHDGVPSDRNDFIAWRESLRGIGLFCLFIHSHATLLAAQGTPLKVPQERLDHASLSTILDTHPHAAPNLQEEAIKQFGASLVQVMDKTRE